MSKPPTAKEMESFCRQFCNTEWQELIKNGEFVRAVSEDMGKARKLSSKILEKEWNT